MKSRFAALMTGMALYSFFLIGPVQIAQSSELPREPSAEETMHIERLAALARLWGAVKFRHPYMYTQNIDWDTALLQALPDVRSAGSNDEYLRAVNRMLAVLNDPATHAAQAPSDPINPGRAEANPNVGSPEPVRLDGTTAIVHCVTAAATSSWTRLVADNAVLHDAIENSAPIIFDCRAQPHGLPVSYNQAAQVFMFMHAALAALVAGSYPASTVRYTFHKGYPTQALTGSTTFSAGLQELAQHQLSGTPQSKAVTQRRISIILDQPLRSTFMLVAGLQTAGKLKIVEERRDRGLELDFSSREIALTPNNIAYVRMQEMVNPDGTAGFQPDIMINPDHTSGTNDAAMSEAIRITLDDTHAECPPLPKIASILHERRDAVYPDMDFSDVNLRLLGLFRLWTVIDSFYPYKETAGESWRSVLIRYIPRMEKIATRLEYEQILLEITAALHDSHVNVFPTRALFESLGGAFLPPISMRMIRGKVVITRVVTPQSGLSVGSIVTAIDGEPIEKRLSRFAPLVSESSVQGFYRPASRIFTYALAGAENSIARFEILNSLGPHAIKIARTGHSLPAEERKTPSVSRVAPDIGYVDVTRLESDEMRSAVESFINTSALIVDVRGYPRAEADDVGRLLADSDEGRAYARVRIPYVFNEDVPSFLEFEQSLSGLGSRHYHGKIFVLINEDTFSQGEQLCLMLAVASKRTTFVGTPTLGANGNVTQMELPGRYFVNFTGLAVQHADGQTLQHRGIQPDRRVAPTIQGIRLGRDEVLGAAIALAKRSLLQDGRSQTSDAKRQ